MQSPKTFSKIGRNVTKYIQDDNFDIDYEDTNEVKTKRYVDLVSFCLMPNHFHLCLQEHIKGGISTYMHKISTAYAKYYTTKYEHEGHLFQGTFKAVHILDNEQLTYLTAYIHRNPREIKEWRNKEDIYPWSSYQGTVAQ